MYGYIYLTTNLINGKKYIGKKKSDIFLGQKYLGSGKRLTEAVNKYGEENFNLDLLEECNSLQTLNEREKYYISLYDAVKSINFYNIAPGGDGGVIWEEGHHPSLGRRKVGKDNPFYGKHHTKEDIEKQKTSFKQTLLSGYVPPVKNKHQIRKDNIIKYVSLDEAYKFIEEGWTCIYINNLERNKLIEQGLITVGMKGRNQTEFQKKRASETHKNKIISQGQINKFKNTMANKTEEEKQLRSNHCREAQKQMRWVVKDGVDPIRINVKDFDKYISQGYHQGRK